MAVEKKGAQRAKAESATEDTAKEEAAPEPQEAPQEDTYSTDRLISESLALFDQSPHFVSGALVAADPDKEEWTLKEAESAVSNFETYQVETDQGEEEQS